MPATSGSAGLRSMIEGKWRVACIDRGTKEQNAGGFDQQRHALRVEV